MSSESLNLTGLASSLPSHSLNAQAEKALLDNFKGAQRLPSIFLARPFFGSLTRSPAAALSITTLYRSSRHASKRAYNSGYAAACRDLLEVLQVGVSDAGQSSESGMTVGRVMDWLEARMEAVKAREEEEDEEEGVTASSHARKVRCPRLPPSSI